MINTILLKNKDEYNVFKTTGELIINSNLYNDLFDYYLNNTTDFYEVMKDGDANEYIINQLKGENMTKITKTLEKDYDIMKAKVDKLLEQIDTLVGDFDEKYDVDLSNDLHFKLDEVSDMIQDNFVDSDVLED